MDKLRDFFRRHPLVPDALVWAVPAIVFGAVLRALFISYLPYALYGADSRSYFGCAHTLIHDGGISIGGKRRFLYPLLMIPVALLPGGALRWLPLIQHALGLVTLVPLAYVVRKTLRYWKIWVVPVTVIYSGFPVVVWCEHELLGECVFFMTWIWAFAGWAAWIGQDTVERSRRMFWWFFVPFALFILTKPSGRFVWPGIFAALVIVAAWRLLTRQHVLALAAILAITPAVGSPKQGGWLLYTAVFPLTRLDTPLHAEYKAEIKDLVTHLRDHLDTYYLVQHDEPFHFLRDPDLQTARPLWATLGAKGNGKLQEKIYKDLEIEAITARPDLFLYLGLQRFVATASSLQNGNTLYNDGDMSRLFAKFYQEGVDDENNPIRLALALPMKGPIPPYAEFRSKLEPAPGSWRARAVQACANAYGKRINLLRFPDVPQEQRTIWVARPTLLGVWIFVGGLLSLLPRYRRILGVWSIIAAGYLFGVFLVSVINAHYFAPAWPVLLLLLAVPVEIILAFLMDRCAKPRS